MLEDEKAPPGHRTWRRRAAIALAIFFALLVIFHRPILLGLSERLAVYFAGKEHLKLALHLEGNLFSRLTVRNLRIVSTGPGLVESIDADLVRADFSLWTLIRHGFESSLHDVEIRNARVVLDPANDTIKPLRPKPDELLKIFPEHVRISNGTLVLRDRPSDLVAEHIDLTLNAGTPGELRIGRLQMIGGQSWSNLVAQTSSNGRNLVLTNLALGDDRIEHLEADISHLREHPQSQLALNLRATIGGGRVVASMKLMEEGGVASHETVVEAKNVDANAINKYATLPEGVLRGQIDELTGDLRGKFDHPDTWIGKVTTRIAKFASPVGGFDHGVISAWAKEGKTGLESTEIVIGESHVRLQGTAKLPKDVDDLPRSPARLEISSDVFDLARVTEGMPQHLSGSAQLTGQIEIKDAKLNSSLDLSISNVGFEKSTAEALKARVTISKIIPPAKAKKPWFQDLRSDLTFEATNLRFREYALDSIQGAIRSADDSLKVEQVVAKRKSNELTVRGEYRLPADIGQADKQPGAMDLVLNAPELADYWFAADSPDKVSGPLQINGQVKWSEGSGNGQMYLYGSNLRMRNLVFHQVTSQWSVAKSIVYVNDFTASLNEHDFINANGEIDLHAPYRYRGKVSANVSDLSTFKAILEASGNKNELGGSLVMDWEGNGEIRTINNTGQLNFTLDKVRYGTLRSMQGKVDASYTPDGLDVPIIFFSNDKMIFQAIAQAKGETFEISKIQLDQGQAKYASGYVSVPFVWRNLGSNSPIFPGGGKVAVNFQSESIDLKKLFEDVGAKPAASGVVNVKFDASGTLDKLDAHLDFQARDLRSPMLPNLDPATFDLSAQTRENQLDITGKLQQAKIQPIELTATLPFNAAQVLSERKLSDSTPVTGKVKMPRSSVNFLRQFVPQIEQLDGDMALDVDIKGTIAQPVLSGAGDITVNVARSNNVTLPALRDFKARLNFSGDTLKLEQFGGELSGGKFTLTGGLKFTKLTAPDIDLQFKADSILVARNDSITARTDADIKVVGPFTSASVTGTIALTNSQFLKNLDLIPIGLPGRPAPQPPAAREEFSFPTPPLRDWKFDVAIKTKDPFLIRGNLANGGAVSDLHLTGTGLHPGLEGTIRLEKVEATLPFSRLEIAYGFLYFNVEDSMNPRIDLHGTTVIRDYTIHVYIYGTSLAPEAIFTSEPPLPQEEVISLLATGTTREELAGNNSVLASRAAMLLVQQLYRKVFKKGQATESNTVFDRLDLDVGQTDPRTGQRQATARFKINEHFVLVGDLDVGGGFRGMVKYLIRFH